MLPTLVRSNFPMKRDVISSLFFAMVLGCSVSRAELILIHSLS
jgi:hypothetical protein